MIIVWAGAAVSQQKSWTDPGEVLISISTFVLLGVVPAWFLAWLTITLAHRSDPSAARGHSRRSKSQPDREELPGMPPADLITPALYQPVGGPGSRARSPPLAAETRNTFADIRSRLTKPPIFDSPERHVVISNNSCRTIFLGRHWSSLDSRQSIIQVAAKSLIWRLASLTPPGRVCCAGTKSGRVDGADSLFEGIFVAPFDSCVNGRAGEVRGV